ncbi:hypothetical protein Acsp03_42530 [Actinomadura sp. NBRC 104412]|uniref:hypothetical protein n=1 Tax=Actinomadura sp. NBRC 104412 TaxID=3032203 RepID=UPI0024A09309|nr:hypothetical protein [Actinomadura sp. NBRC 104412]GLZ06787.1 hypothetical protein Acsp03_42530 [Actinomadura sp. NBRC 104412]
MPNDDFRELLSVMPDIAAAVNTFNSEAAQLKALKALIQTARNGSDRPALTTATAVALPSQPSERASVQREIEASSTIPALPPAPSSDADAALRVEPTAKKPRKASAKKSISPVRGLNFAPDGKQPLADFVAQKQPRTMFEKNLAACYYLQEIMEISNITVGHVLAVYQFCSWSSASQPDVSLRQTASKRGWIDTSDSKDIKLEWGGQNYLETQMPSSAPTNGGK